MVVCVRLFGRYREILARTDLSLELPGGATVADLVSELHERIPGRLPESLAVAVNRKQAMNDQVIYASDEVALIPPVAGG